MEKVIVLENGFDIDVPQELKSYLNRNKIDWELYDMRQRFWPENEAETIKFFSTQPENQSFYCHTVFEDFIQLELMIELLFALKDKKFTVKIMHDCLAEDLLKFYDETESSITPEELRTEMEAKFKFTQTPEEENALYDKYINGFKRKMNEKFLTVLKYHNVFWVTTRKEYKLKSISDIKKAHR